MQTGPVVGGYLAQDAGWRSIFYPREFFLNMAKLLHKTTGNPNWKLKYDKGQTPNEPFTAAIVRPTTMILRPPDCSPCYLYVHSL